MKIFESAPSRYDMGIRILTCGRLKTVYERLATHIDKGQRVLDIGCGTGALTLLAAQKDAKVKAIDVNPHMLEIAQQRLKDMHLSQNVEFCEMGVAELESEDPQSYDIAVSGLCFSELSADELNYALKQTRAFLKPGGLLLIADEVSPKPFLKKLLNGLMRIPLVIITYLLTQTTTRAVRNLPQKIKAAGFIIDSIKLNPMENFIELIARKPQEIRH
jgi:demethylmenaquinone methyltransferase/2-methoxy-6-polyprenyl-1,4-benzoquinol methylase